MSNNPKLYYFNPGHEGAILTLSPYYTPPANMVNMQNDLAYLSAWYATPSDSVLLQCDLPSNFVKYLVDNLSPIAKGYTEHNIDRTLPEIHLWGISPQSINYFEKLGDKYHFEFILPKWDDELRNLSSREMAKICLLDLCEHIPSISDKIIPNFYSDLDEIENLVKTHTHQYLAKAPFSSSGRGLLWLPIEELTQTERQILQGILNKQKNVSIEKALDKKLDFAMEFILEDDTIHFEGYSLFQTNNKGAYLGNYLGAQSNIIHKIKEFISLDLLENVKNQLLRFLQSNYQKYYKGCIGVDMLVYQENEEYKLHPCIEINVRDNMGLLAIKLSKNYLKTDAEGTFNIDFCSEKGEQLIKHHEMSERHPALFSNGRIKSGYLSLCPVNEMTKYRAYIIVN